MPRLTNSARTKSWASAIPISGESSRGERELDLAGKLRVLAQLGDLDRIPQLLACTKMIRRAVRQHHL